MGKPTPRDRLTEWRGAVARLYLTGITTIIPVMLVGWALLRPGPWLDAPFLFIAGSWTAFLVTRLLAPAGAQAVVVVGLLSAIGVLGPMVLGLSPGPFLSAVSAVVISSLVFSRRVGFALLALETVALVVIGVLAPRGLMPGIHPEPTDPFIGANWGRITVMFSLSTALLLFLMTGLFSRIEAAWREAEESAARERREHQQRLAAEERAAAAQRLEAVGRLAGGIAHDFNNALLVIMSWTDLLRSAKSDAERAEGLDAIRESSTHAAQLTRQLLSFARKSVTRPGSVDLDAAIGVNLKSIRRLLPADVKVEHVPAKHPRARADEGQVGQVLLNLATNAADAMPKGGTLTFSTAVVEPPALPPEAPAGQRFVTLVVEDTGIGMDEETRAHIFEPFFTTKSGGRGTGLGLASVYGIVTQAGGWARVESAPGRGSRFTIAFPVAPDGETAPAASPVPAAAAQPQGQSGTILLVEDDPAVRASLARALSGAGYVLVEAGTADEALAIARRHREEFDLLCTDGVMPGLPTHLLVEEFRQLFPHAPVLVCSGYLEEALVQRGIAEGTVSFLGKPFDAETLVTRVRELLGSRRQRPV